jgi:hypothetical protein
MRKRQPSVVVREHTRLKDCLLAPEDFATVSNFAQISG